VDKSSCNEGTVETRKVSLMFSVLGAVTRDGSSEPGSSTQGVVNGSLLLEVFVQKFQPVIRLLGANDELITN